MAYIKRTWEDRAVEFPRRYDQTIGADGKVTLVPAPGEVAKAGTPLNAANMNAIEEGLQHTSVAFEYYYVTSQAQMRDLEARLALAEAKLATLAP
jgi:hypothetical protein